MTASEQKQFVRELCASIRDSVIAHIENGKVPEVFDGHELRVWLCEEFKDAAKMSLLRKHPHSQRNKSYHEWRVTTPT